MATNVYGLFTDQSRAQSAAQQLNQAGFSSTQIIRSESELTTLSTLGIPRQEMSCLEQGVRQGGAVVVNTAPDESSVQRMAEILRSNGVASLDDCMVQWKQGGWDGRDSRGEEVIPIVEEELQIGKRQVNQGGVRIHSRIEEIPVEESVQLRSEHVEVERHPVNRAATEADFAAATREVEMTEMAEEPVIQKQARVVEEVGLHKEVEQRTETVRDTVRHTEVDVENLTDRTYSDTELEERRRRAA
jgi:uncharacterized protein (TIGR02271 family)